MSGVITALPRHGLCQARLLVADPSGHDSPQVLEACDVLERYGNRTDQIRARALRTAILSRTIQCHGRRQAWQRRLVLLANAIGILALFGLLFLFLLFTPA